MSGQPAIISIKHVSKHYALLNNKPQNVLHDITLDIVAGQFVAIIGQSGNGKSTLLNLIAGIDRPTQGEVWVNNTPLHELSEEKLTRWRGANMGIVFQFFQLLPALNLLQNIMLPMDFLGRIPKAQRQERARQLLAMVGMEKEACRLPSQVSGGQQQRVAIARALANDPPLVVADEPTGNLDSEAAESVFKIFTGLASQGKTLVMVTHNPVLAASGDRILTIHAGRIASDSARS